MIVASRSPVVSATSQSTRSPYTRRGPTTMGSSNRPLSRIHWINSPAMHRPDGSLTAPLKPRNTSAAVNPRGIVSSRSLPPASMIIGSRSLIPVSLR